MKELLSINMHALHQNYYLVLWDAKHYMILPKRADKLIKLCLWRAILNNAQIILLSLRENFLYGIYKYQACFWCECLKRKIFPLRGNNSESDQGWKKSYKWCLPDNNHNEPTDHSCGYIYRTFRKVGFLW